MKDTIAQYISQHRLLNRDGSPCLVALSGGADSVCLLLVLQQLDYPVEAVHCNFKLRGEESDRDEQFVVSLCKKHGIKYHLIHFDTRTYASIHKVSIEMAARELRYAYFEQLRHDIGTQAICVAHHQDDAVETILMNLIRGTGLHGLTGIRPRNGHVVRPLLCVSRKDIESWLKQQGQPYVTDSTNLVPDVVRNKLRLQILPRLHDINASAAENILTTARRLAEAARIYDEAVDCQLKELVSDETVDIQQLLLQPSPESLLFEWLTPFGFSPATVEAICLRLPDAQSGRQWCSASHQLTVHQGRLSLCQIEPEPPTLLLPELGTYIYKSGERRVERGENGERRVERGEWREERMERGEWREMRMERGEWRDERVERGEWREESGESKLRIEQREGRHILRDASAASLDAEKVCFPLTLRPVQAGDRFMPFGMKGTKLISDYLTDCHIPLPQKRRQLVLTDADGHILWLVGHRPDARYCVDDNTTQTLLINFTPNE